MQFHQPKRLAPIKCPLCGRLNDIIVNGLINNFDGTWDADEETGYAFCNCRNIFYTDWKNIDLNIYSNPKYIQNYEHEKYCDLENHRKRYAYGSKVYFPIILKERKDKLSFLDLGFGMDSLLDEAKKLGWKTTALDIAPRKIKKDHEFICLDFERSCIALSEFYDVIWASHIFEHFQDPIEMLRKCHRILTKRGYLFISMPDPMFIDWKGDPYEWVHWVHKEHHIMWDMDSSFCETQFNPGV